MTTKEKLEQENKKLRQKNAYFTREVPKLKDRLDKLNLLAEKQRVEHTKLMRSKDHELLKATDMIDQLQENLDIMSRIKMDELLGGIMVDR